MALPNSLMPLNTERACFEDNYPVFAQDHLGEVVLISGTNVLGFFISLPVAEENAYRKHGLFGQPFLLRTILPPEEEQQAETFQRSIIAEIS